MRSETKLANIQCFECGWELLVQGEVIFCQNPECKHKDGTYKQIRPKVI